MPRPATMLVPLSGIGGNGPIWHSSEDEPWFQLSMAVPSSGGWLKLGWESALSNPVTRPALRFIGENGEPLPDLPDILVSGAALGRAFWIGHVPMGTVRIQLSPFDRPGDFGFQLTEARWVTSIAAVLAGLRVQPLMALHALGAATILRRADFRILLEEAINARPIRQYGSWFQTHHRPPDWDAFDCPGNDIYPRLHLFHADALTLTEQDELHSLPAGVPIQCHALDPAIQPETPHEAENLLATILERTRDSPETDLVFVLPRRHRLHFWALPALATAAAHKPEVEFFFGDEIEHLADGTLKPLFRTGFDPLWTLKSLAGSGAVAWRIGGLRRLGGKHGVCANPIGAALFRPLISRMPQSVPSPALTDIVAKQLASSEPSPSSVSDADPVINIVIPTRDRLDLLRACIDSILPTISPRSGITIVDNESIRPETLTYFAGLENHPRIKVIRSPGEFNFSRLSNEGARARPADCLVFLNNDTTIIEKDWLQALIFHAMRPDIGAVGAKLVYPSGRLQHGGVALGIGGYAGHIDLGASCENAGTLGRLNDDHSLMAVTGACLAVSREKFEAVGGFDEVHLPVDLNDIDLCLRLHERGWRTVFAAGALLVHHESASRGRRSTAPRYRRERAYFFKRWRNLLRKDAFYHPILSLMLTRPSLGA
jgi:O-antigen biosynthesis protein